MGSRDVLDIFRNVIKQPANTYIDEWVASGSSPYPESQRKAVELFRRR
jgi:hypothetical protein